MNLFNNNIRDEGAAAIADALKGNGVLTSLDVSFNKLTEVAALGIIRVERHRNKLTSLGLARCQIGPSGAAELAEYVSGSEVLTKLVLWLNTKFNYPPGGIGWPEKNMLRHAASGRVGFELKM